MTKNVSRYDVVIVGAGPAGLFAAYHLAENSSLKVCLVEKGREVRRRKCPIADHGKCIRCTPCQILSGVGGAGLFSDGKLNYIHKLGKTDLTQFMSVSEAKRLIDETETIFNRFGMDGRVYPSDMEEAKAIRRRAKKSGIDLLLIKQKHLGSDNLPGYIGGMTDYICEKGIDLRCGEEVQDLIVKDGKVDGVITSKGEIHGDNVILSPGRVGAEWVGKLAARHKLNYSQRGIEVGVRIEVHKDVLHDLTDIVYDPTFFVQTHTYDDQVRTFCTNREGFVALENYQDFVCVNGHAYSDKKSDVSNFAFLSKVVLTEPVADNHGYGEAIGRLATLIGGGKPILQRFGDLKRGRRSTWNRIRKGSFEPTLTNVTCGDIAMALPHRVVTNLIEGLEQLNEVVPGVANEETLLYAPEIKFFATQIDSDNDLHTEIDGLYVAGDGPGVAGNIVSASATGLIPAKAIISKTKA